MTRDQRRSNESGKRRGVLASPDRTVNFQMNPDDQHTRTRAEDAA